MHMKEIKAHFENFTVSSSYLVDYTGKISLNFLNTIFCKLELYDKIFYHCSACKLQVFFKIAPNKEIKGLNFGIICEFLRVAEGKIY